MSAENMQGIEAPEVSCDNCVGACCRAAAGIVLSDIERSRHRKAMTLKTIVKPKPHEQQFAMGGMEQLSADGQRQAGHTQFRIPKYHGFHILLTDCGYLSPDDFTCQNYDERPDACIQYEVGSPECLAARATYGLDGHEEIVSSEIKTEPITLVIPRTLPRR